MLRQIITINTDLCNGCGLCVSACHEGAIGLVDGKAQLLHDDYCDGLGNCLPACPCNAIAFEEREAAAFDAAKAGARSRLSQWPVQIQLVPQKAAFFDNAPVLIAADCAAYAYSSFHSDFMRDTVTLIGCPKLDHVDYSEKLAAIITANALESITVVRMEVPCCGGLERAVLKAMETSGSTLNCRVHTLSVKGQILE
ncbi:ATP-binding protein [Breznakiellaceae bacterium SP9]